MAFEGPKGKISDEALAALRALDQGARMNCVHTISRELIAAGYAHSDWDVLMISEAGRRIARNVRWVNYAAQDDNIGEIDEADLNRRYIIAAKSMNKIMLDPMSTPSDIKSVSMAAKHFETEIPMKPEEVTVVPTSSWRDRALRAAGVASGETGLWPSEKWVTAFIAAMENPEI